MAQAVLGLGGNLGARRALFRAAIALLDALPGCSVLSLSPLYVTPPLGPPQPDYLNAGVLVRWAGEPLELLHATQQIELALGRERRVHWGPRTLDIDLLHWSEGALAMPGLEVPHRELDKRAFALAPLLDVVPALAAQWGRALALLGGPPPRAEPGWSRPLREGQQVCSVWTRDQAELASQLGDLLAGAIVGEVRASSTRAFSGPLELFDVHGGCWLEGEIERAVQHGFWVRRVAIVEQRSGATRGVFVGEQRDRSLEGAVPTWTLERRGGEEMRVCVRSSVADDGFDFAGSVTM